MQKLNYITTTLLLIVIFSPYKTMSNESGLMLEEVIVTAQKRMESSQNVPLSITSIAGDNIRLFEWDNAIDIVKQSAALSAETWSGKSLPRFKIRGLGTSDYNIGQLSAVGFYVNEVVINSPISHGIEIYDLERVEILRGPQGTLWGKNNTGGAINIVTAKPTHEYQLLGSSSTGYVNNDAIEYQLESVVNASISENLLAARLALKRTSRDNWIDNVATGDKVGKTDSTAGRLSLLYTPSTAWDISLIMEISDQEDDAYSYAGLAADGSLAKPDIYKTNLDTNNFDQNEYKNITLHATWQSDHLSFITISSYIETERNVLQDEDASSSDILFDTYLSNIEQYNQEFRITSSPTDAFRWILGFHYFTENVGGISSFAGGLDSVASAGSGNIIVFETGQEKRERESYAFFGNLQTELSKQLSLHLGARITHDKEDIDALRASYNVNGMRRDDFYNIAAANPGSLSVIEDIVDNLSNTEPTYDATVKYSFTDNVQTYLRYAHGYRSGTFAPPFFLSVVAAEPEFVDAIELGVKSRLDHGRIELNAAFYHYDIDDQQEVGFLGFADDSSIINLFRNAATSTVQGFELESKVMFTEQLYIEAGIGVINAKYDDFAVSPTENNKGNEFARTPDWTFNLLINYLIPLHHGTFTFSTDWRAQPKVFVNANNTELGVGDEYLLGNLKVLYETNSERWSLAVWTRNLLNENYYINRTGDGSVAYAGEPQISGITLSIKLE